MSAELRTYTSVRIDDTAEWRLVIFISDRGMSAYLKNLENPLDNIVTLFDERWQLDDTMLLHRIEECVYNHPQLFDDFATEIIICTLRALWFPEKAGRDSEMLMQGFNSVFPNDETNVLEDEREGMTCVYSLTPGLPSFLRRTLSGAKISSHQGVLVSKFIKQKSDSPVLYIDIRNEDADYILIENGKLLLASTHQWHNMMDIGYMAINIFDVYGLNPQMAQVSLSGETSDKQELVRILREQISYVMFTLVPTAVSKVKMPLSAAISLCRQSNN